MWITFNALGMLIRWGVESWKDNRNTFDFLLPFETKRKKIMEEK